MCLSFRDSKMLWRDFTQLVEKTCFLPTATVFENKTSIICSFSGLPASWCFVREGRRGDFSISSNPFQIHLNFSANTRRIFGSSFVSCIAIVASASFFQISGDWPMNAWTVAVLCERKCDVLHAFGLKLNLFSFFFLQNLCHEGAYMPWISKPLACNPISPDEYEPMPALKTHKDEP